jgi:cytochrome P450
VEEQALEATAVPDFDLSDEAVVEDPFPVFTQLRDRAPAHQSRYLGGFVLTRYDDVRSALWLSVERIAPFFDHLDRKSSSLYGSLRNIGLWMTFNDAPMHGHLRRLVARVLTPACFSAAEPLIREVAAELVSGMPEEGEVDFMATFASWLPIGVMTRMLGVPKEDVPLLRQWTDEINLFVGAAKKEPEKYARAARGVGEMTAYYLEQLAHRRSSPGSDVLTGLATVSDGEDRLSDEEVAATCVNLTHAGHVTTAHLLGNGLLALCRQPSQMGLLRADRSLLAGAVEEMLRFDGPIQAMVRVADRDLQLHGVTIPAGTRIFPMVNAANRDPRRFQDADRFDVRRRDNRHIVFGHGPHACMGMALARLEIPIALTALFDCFVEVELAGRPEWIDSVAFRGPARLPVAVSRGRSASRPGAARAAAVQGS